MKFPKLYQEIYLIVTSKLSWNQIKHKEEKDDPSALLLGFAYIPLRPNTIC